MSSAKHQSRSLIALGEALKLKRPWMRAFIRLTQADTIGFRNYFVEIDRGNTSSSKFASKMQIHQYYLDSGLFLKAYASPIFQTLVVTTGEKRAMHLKDLAEQHQNREKRAIFCDATEPQQRASAPRRGHRDAGDRRAHSFNNCL